MSVLGVFEAFFRDVRTLSILALVALDLVTGIMAALHSGTFAWDRVATFYRTNVVPYVLGYLLVYTLEALGLRPILDGVFGPGWWDQFASMVGVGVIWVTVGASIARNLAELRPAPPPPPGP